MAKNPNSFKVYKSDSHGTLAVTIPKDIAKLLKITKGTKVKIDINTHNSIIITVMK